MTLTGDTFDFQQGNVVTSSAQMVDNAATVGNVLTVQADKSIAAAPGGGSQPFELLGPFTVNYNTPDIGDGALLTLLDSGTVVLLVQCITLTGWDGSSPILSVALGNLDYGPPDDDWALIQDFDVSNSSGTTGVQGPSKSLAAVAGSVASGSLAGGRLTAPGALVAFSSDSGAAQGQSLIYALVTAQS